MDTELEKVILNNQVAVLYSPPYGAGWYTWNTKHPQLLFHPTLVNLVLEDKHKEITEELMKELFGDVYICILGAGGLKVTWLTQGTLFRIDEYDGAEEVIVLDFDDYLTA